MVVNNTPTGVRVSLLNCIIATLRYLMRRLGGLKRIVFSAEIGYAFMGGMAESG